MLNLDPNRSATEPTPAATLLLVRNASGDGIELFFVRRHAKSPFLGGAVVFPGGKLDAADATWTCTDGLAPAARLASDFAADDAQALALAVCACRESLEEAGVLPTVPVLDNESVLRLRQALADTASLERALERVAPHARLATSSLRPFARWVTPTAEARRFDARFFLAPSPPGQRGTPDAHETVAAVWATPQSMLDAFHRGDVFLAPPTLRALELLAPCTRVEDALSVAERQSLAPICPVFVPGPPAMLTIPGDPLHPDPIARVEGATRFVERDGRFVSEPR